MWIIEKIIIIVEDLVISLKIVYRKKSLDKEEDLNMEIRQMDKIDRI